MKRIVKRALWVAGGGGLLLLIAAAAATVYLARHPDRIKDVLEETASRATGLDIRLKDLHWSATPLRVRAEGITVASREPSEGAFRAAVDSAGADLALLGGFGDRVLVVERVSARGVDVSLHGTPSLPRRDAGPSSRLTRVAAGLLRYLLVRDVRVERVDLAQGRIRARTAAGRLDVDRLEAGRTRDGKIGLSCRVHLHHLESGLRIQVPGIRAEATPTDTETAVPWSVRIEEGTLSRGELTVAGLAFQAAGRVAPSGSTVFLESLDLTIPDARPLVPVSLGAPLEARLRASGRIHPGGGRIEMDSVSATLHASAAHLSLETKIAGAWSPALQGTVDSLSCRFQPESWLPLLPEKTRAPFAPLRFQGEVSLSGGAEMALDGEAIRLHPNLSLELHDNPVAFLSPSMEVRARISGDLRAQGAWPEPEIAGTIKGKGISVKGGGLSLQDATARMRVDGGIDTVRVRDVDLQAPALRIGAGERAFSLQAPRLRIQEARLDVRNSTLTCPGAQVEAQGLGPFHLTAKARKETAVLSVRGKDTGLPALLSREGFPLSGWGLQGRDDIRLQVEKKESGSWLVTNRLAVEDLAFEHAGMGMFAEGVSLTLDAKGTLAGEPASSLNAVATLRSESGEFLLDRYYLNAGDHPLSLTARVRGDPSQPIVHLDGLEGALSGLLSLRVSGTLERLAKGLRAGLSVSIPPFALGPAFRQFAAEPFKMIVPALAQMGVKGTASADFRVDMDPGGLAVVGDAHVRQATVSVEEPGVMLQDVDLVLPIWYDTFLRADHSPPPKEGRLHIRSLQVPVLPPQPLSITFQALPNRLRIPGPTVLKIPGGDLRIHALDLENDPEKGPVAETRISLDRVALQPMLTKVWPQAPEGNVHGTLSSVRYHNGSLTTRGSLEAGVFEGRLVLDRLGASGLFSSAPVFRFDARWNDLNLKPMTEGTAFGRVTGVLKGHLKGFELAYGQPQAFDLLLETVPEKGVPQRISVTAVDNIARIGGGGSPFIGMAGFFTSLFREFPYERIGAHAVLENDVFRINGTIRDGGKEYLIKRSGFSGVNVVNQNPDNQIRFKDMVKRIQRITASRGGPVIR